MKPFTIELPDMIDTDAIDVAHRVAETIDSFLEVNRLLPPAVMPAYKPR